MSEGVNCCGPGTRVFATKSIPARPFLSAGISQVRYDGLAVEPSPCRRLLKAEDMAAVSLLHPFMPNRAVLLRSM